MARPTGCVGAWTVAAAALAGGAAVAQTVSLAGSLGADKALLMIDGRPQVLVVGASASGVRLRRLADGQAEVEVAGRVSLLRLGESPAQFGGGSGGSVRPPQIVLRIGADGHFVGQGAINGRAVQFLVDTGATTVAIGRSEAERLGLDWQRGPRSLGQTANGTVAVHGLTLGSVRLAGVELSDVAAVVLPADLPMVLLGNNFLARFTMQRDGDLMRLDKKP